MKRYKIDIIVPVLGTEYHIFTTSASADGRMKNADGFCDETVKEIGICDFSVFDGEERRVRDSLPAIHTIIKHELVHAFLFESGLGYDWTHDSFGQEETTVDWIARQLDKIYDAAWTTIGAIQETDE